jgi:rhodanese-related sulfurtransferase
VLDEVRVLPTDRDREQSGRDWDSTGGDSAIARHLAEVRGGLRRVRAEDFDDVVGAGALVVDIRPEANRRIEGGLAEAVVVERIHLEWRLDPTSPDRIPQADQGRLVVIVCNEGYSSSLAAATLVTLGVAGATDLIGGYRALRAVGSASALPPTPAPSDPQKSPTSANCES